MFPDELSQALQELKKRYGRLIESVTETEDAVILTRRLTLGERLTRAVQAIPTPRPALEVLKETRCIYTLPKKFRFKIEDSEGLKYI
jgi:hypothetical protein